MQSHQDFECLLFARLALVDEEKSVVGRALRMVLAHYAQRADSAPVVQRMGALLGAVGVKALWAEVAETGAVVLGKTLGVFIDRDTALRCVAAIDAVFAALAEPGGARPLLLLQHKDTLRRLREVLAAAAHASTARRFLRFDALPRDAKVLSRAQSPSAPAAAMDKPVPTAVALHLVGGRA